MKKNCSKQCPSSPEPATRFNLPALFQLCTLPAGLLFFAALALGLASPWPDDQDGVNFLLGLKNYDVAGHQPHFPGYPVYIAVAKILNLFVNSPEWTFIFISVFSGVICVSLIVKMSGVNYGRATGLICACALAFNTAFFEFSHKIFSEIPALALLLLVVTVLGDAKKQSSNRKYFFGGIALGLLMGIRLSWWPFPLFYLFYGFRIGAGQKITAGFFLGIAFWLIPQVAFVGVADLFAGGWNFTLGHFTDWGAGAGFSFFEKIPLFSRRMAEAMGWIGSGAFLTRIPWIIFSVYGLSFLFRPKFLREHEYKQFIGATFFYLLWVVAGQNPEKVRHLIPVIPAVLLAIAPVISRNRKTATTAVALLALTLPIDYASRVYDTPPAARFLLWSASNGQSPSAVYYCGESERFFDLYQTGTRVVNVKNADEMDYALKASWPAPKPDKTFVCNDIPGLKPTGKLVKTFPARLGDPVDLPLVVSSVRRIR